jgi:recombinational DNA repair protein (RecF pathway)
MSYHTYTTEAIVCGTYRHNTDDCSYLLFTRLHGMVFATARSVRLERSRQRYALQDFAYIMVSLVKGKSGWRIGSVEARGNFFTPLHTRKARAAAVQIVTMTRRLVLGEEAYEALFVDCVTALTVLQENDVAAAALADLYTLRALWRLGYVKQESALVPFLLETCDYRSMPEHDALHRAVSQGLLLSHL